MDSLVACKGIHGHAAVSPEDMTLGFDHYSFPEITLNDFANSFFAKSYAVLATTFHRL